MALDSGTLVTALMLVCLALAGVMAMGWVLNRSAPALGAWAAVFALCAGGAALTAVRGQIPDYLALDAANALRLLAFGLGWQIACRFSGRNGSWVLAFAPAILWLAAAATTGLAENESLRVLLASGIVAAFGFAIAAELWWGARKSERIVRAAAVLMALHATFYFSRFVAVVFGSNWKVAELLNPVAIGESLVFAVLLAFLLLSAAMDQLLASHRQAALIDPLTGIGNRRGFEAEMERMLARARRDNSFTTLLLLDIDHFKAVNDSRGHVVGDRALQAFSAAISKELRAGDLMARLGGEEFAVALAGCGPEQALKSAERMRKAVAERSFSVGGAAIRLTVSIGVACQRGVEALDVLMEAADIALYQAKAGGRDRVETASARPMLAKMRPAGEAASETAAARQVA